MQAEPLFAWSEPLHELAGFVGLFLSAGAIGFRYAVVRGRLAGRSEAGTLRGTSHAGVIADTERALYADAARRAATFGLVGAVIAALLTAFSLPALAARRHVAVGQLLTGDVLTAIQAAMLVLAVIGFALAAARRPIGWPLAAIGVIVGALRGALLGQWSRLVNPVHSLAAALWIGTLFVLVVAGLVAVLRSPALGERRGGVVADMVNAFSPLALTMGGVVVLFGVITGWRHLRGDLANLWTTPYGWALIAKLCAVAVVFALGAWNWRRQRPTLGTEAAAVGLRRSATSELVAAAVVLVITSILLSIPAPRPPGPPPGAASPRSAAP